MGVLIQLVGSMKVLMRSQIRIIKIICLIKKYLTKHTSLKVLISANILNIACYGLNVHVLTNLRNSIQGTDDGKLSIFLFFPLNTIMSMYKNHIYMVLT